ncbi:MAG: sugar phosphate isomerase/epimerase [Chloroflexi bacterium]|nr:sugar phosphate isomerase/epimerase [Chloroflexota bacterium]
MWTLSAFADEISPDLHVQVETLLREGITHLELRGVAGNNVLALTDSDIAIIRTTLDQHGIKVSSIGSPIGKISIGDEFGPHYTAFERALHVAQVLEAPFIRIFSFFMPPGEDPARYRDQVLDRLHQLVRRAEGTGITLLHENEKEIYGDIPSRCHDILSQINSPSLRAAWDPANFVQCGVQPYSEGYAALRPFIAYVHVKDAVRATGAVVPAGHGDGEWPDTLTALHSSGFDGFFSLEPHLQEAGPFAGFSGPDLFHVAAEAFTSLLRTQQIAWR